MQQFMLILAVGPVQDFIASARNSRDLWCGSWLLSEVAKACALKLCNHNAQLIFPSIDHQSSLAPNSELSVGNKVQAIVQAEDENSVRDVVARVKQAGKDYFIAEANKAKQELGNSIREQVWQAQLHAYLEIQAVWVQFDNLSYTEVNEKANRLLAARKATRDFQQTSAQSACDSTFMLPKSSLDGAHETVLAEKMPKGIRQQLRLAEAEQLDCMGVVKRFGGDPEQFTSISRICIDGWLSRLKEKHKQALIDAYESLIDLGVATRVKGNTDGNKNSIYADFPYDGELLYESRLNAEIRSAKKNVKSEENHAETAELIGKLENLRAVLNSIPKDYGKPCPYGVLLLADGDNMGKLIDKAQTQDNHQAITKALSSFAQAVPDIMRENRGHTIYAGGDDVLGFVPLNDAYACADALQTAFQQFLAEVATKLGAQTPTLSVGLAIVHLMTPLANIRQLAKTAESIAKGNGEPDKLSRNALGITLSVRSGAIRSIRLRWDDEDARQALKNWIEAFSKQTLSSRIAYGMQEIVIRTNFPTADDTQLQNIRRVELERMLKQAKTRDGQDIHRDLQVALTERLDQLGDMQKLADELIIARWLAAKTSADILMESSDG